MMYLIFYPGSPDLQILLRYIFKHAYQTHGCAGNVSVCSPAVWEDGGQGDPSDRAAGG